MINTASQATMARWIVRTPRDVARELADRRGGFIGAIAPLEPTPLVRGLARKQSEERRLQRFRDRSAASAADRDAVDRTHGRDFRRRARQENLVSEIEQLARQRLLAHLVTVFAGEGHDGVARNALQDRVRKRGRVDDAVADQEEVLAGAFADVSVDAETDAFGESEPLCFQADELARQIVAGRLAHRGDRVRREALPRGYAHVDTV